MKNSIRSVPWVKILARIYTRNSNQFVFCFSQTSEAPDTHGLGSSKRWRRQRHSGRRGRAASVREEEVVPLVGAHLRVDLHGRRHLLGRLLHDALRHSIWRCRLQAMALCSLHFLLLFNSSHSANQGEGTAEIIQNSQRHCTSSERIVVDQKGTRRHFAKAEGQIEIIFREKRKESTSQDPGWKK